MAELTPEMRAAGAAHGMAEYHMVALRHYTEDGYGALNAALRDGRSGLSTVAADALNEALDKLPAYRGSVVRRTALDDASLPQHLLGTVVDYPAFTSATKGFNRDVMRRKPHRLIIKGITGRDISAWSAAPWQQEVLFGSPHKFYVEAVADKGGFIEIEIREISP